MPPSFEIAGRPIGPGFPVYIVAEMSANHNRSFEDAVRIVRAAKESGADAVKLQTYRPDTLTLDHDGEHFRVQGTPWAGRRLYDLYAEAATPWEWQPKLKRIAAEMGLQLFSTPFDESAVEFLEAMGVPAYKIASFECTDLALLKRVAATNKPIILSTGMATLGEIDEAVRVVREAGGGPLALLKCTSAYPAPPEEMHLRTIPHLADAFGVPVGLSDHTLGVAVAVAAVALGACIVEKHLALSRSRPGPDSAFSLEPAEFRTMVEAVRVAEKALGSVRYGAGEAEEDSRWLRRSLFVVADLDAGEVFTAEKVRAIRPGYGLPPRCLGEVLGRRAARPIRRGTPLSWDLVGGAEEGRHAPG
jgi:pseudaminic acid synthase